MSRWLCSFWKQWLIWTHQQHPHPLPASSPVQWMVISVSENAIKIPTSVWAGFQCCPGCRKCATFSLVAGSGSDFHPSGFSLLLSRCVDTIAEKAWACPKDLGTSMGSVHIPRVCPSPIPWLIPCFSRHIQRFTPGSIIRCFPRLCNLLDLCDGSQGYPQSPFQSVA